MNKDYTLSGWACFFNAVIAIPLMFYFILNDIGFFYHILNFGSLALNAFIHLSFKDALNDRYSFYELNPLIYTMITISFCMMFLNFFLEPLGELVKVIVPLIVVIHGFIKIVIGIILFSLNDELEGLKKILAYCFIFLGICTASILLSVFGIVISIVFDIALGIYFFKSSEILV